MHTFTELGNVSRHLVCLTREITTNLYEKWGASYPLVTLRWESLFSCWNSLQLGLYQSPFDVWNWKFCLPNLQLLEGSMSCCSKTSSLKTIYFLLSLFHVPLLHQGKEGSWRCCLQLSASWTIVLACWDSVLLCCSGCFPAEAEWNGPNCCLFHGYDWRGCMQSFINLQLVLAWSYWKVSWWEEQNTS